MSEKFQSLAKAIENNPDGRPVYILTGDLRKLLQTAGVATKEAKQKDGGKPKEVDGSGGR